MVLETVQLVFESRFDDYKGSFDVAANKRFFFSFSWQKSAPFIIRHELVKIPTTVAAAFSCADPINLTNWTAQALKESIILFLSQIAKTQKCLEQNYYRVEVLERALKYKEMTFEER